MTDPAIPFDLVTLRAAVRYQQWVIRRCAPWLGQQVLEVGAGIGNMTRWLGGPGRRGAPEAHPEPVGACCGAEATPAVRGRCTLKVEPMPSSLYTEMNPPCCLAIP